MYEDNGEFGIDDREKVEKSIFSRVLRGIVALIAFAGLLYISGIQQYFFYQKTPSSVSQTPVENRADGETITLPLTVFIITANEPYGSTRSRDNSLRLVENASQIWNQAGITLIIKNIYTISKSNEEMKIFSNTPAAFFQDIDGFDETTINVFLVGTLGGINGLSFGGLRSVTVADYTTVYDFRVLAHEIGHVLGLYHTSRSNGQLMYQGANGFELSISEIERARLKAQGL